MLGLGLGLGRDGSRVFPRPHGMSSACPVFESGGSRGSPIYAKLMGALFYLGVGNTSGGRPVIGDLCSCNCQLSNLHGCLKRKSSEGSNRNHGDGYFFNHRIQTEELGEALEKALWELFCFSKGLLGLSSEMKKRSSCVAFRCLFLICPGPRFHASHSPPVFTLQTVIFLQKRISGI